MLWPKAIFWPAALLAFVVAVAFNPGRTLSAAQTSRAADEAAIRAVIAANQAATNRRDAVGVAATFVPDGSMWIAGRPRIIGRDAIRRSEEEFYRTPDLQSWNTSIDTIRFLGSDAAIVEVASMTKLRTGQTRERATLILERLDHGWGIVAVRVMTVDKA